MISIIVCTYNRCESLRWTLQSLKEMDVPAGVSSEIIVVDNRSSDRTRDVAEEFRRARGIEVRYIFEASLGLSNARNAGIREAQGEILSFLDDDVRVTPNWVVELKRAFDKYDPICVGGRVLLQPGFAKPRWWDDWCEVPCGRFDQGENVAFGHGTLQDLVGIGANISFKRAAFEKYGLFRPELGRRGHQLIMGEETEFCKRLQSNGELLIYFPTALVYHHPEATRFTRKYIRRWSYRLGEWYHFEDAASRPRVPGILGMPLWRYRSAAADFWKTAGFYCRGCSKKAFRHETRCIEFIGRMVGSLKAPLLGTRER